MCAECEVHEPNKRQRTARSLSVSSKWMAHVDFCLKRKSYQSDWNAECHTQTQYKRFFVRFNLFVVSLLHFDSIIGVAMEEWFLFFHYVRWPFRGWNRWNMNKLFPHIISLNYYIRLRRLNHCFRSCWKNVIDRVRFVRNWMKCHLRSYNLHNTIDSESEWQIELFRCFFFGLWFGNGENVSQWNSFVRHSECEANQDRHLLWFFGRNDK